MIEAAMFGRAAVASGLARELRLAAGFSQGDLAKLLGCSKATISLWETGGRRPQGELARNYFALLHRIATDARVGA